MLVATRHYASKKIAKTTFPTATATTALHQRLFASSSSSPSASDFSSSDATTTSSFYKNAALESLHRRKPITPHPIPSYNKNRRLVPIQNGTIPCPPYAKTGIIPPSPSSLLPFLETPLIHDETSTTKMRNAARLARKMLNLACAAAKQPGVTTEEIDILVHNALVDHGAYPSPLNYAGFPKSLCSSVNEVICHGIPDGRVLEVGDVVSFDVSCFYGGVHGDNCATVIVGDYDDDDDDDDENSGGGKVKTKFESKEQEQDFITARRLVQAAQESLDEAINVCGDVGKTRYLKDVGEAIHDVVDSYGFGTVRKYRGHGIGEVFHCAPFVKHFRNNDTLQLKPGMIFTIEPMITEFSDECYEWDDDWTVVTKDGGRAAQFEHTVLITESGVEILTVVPEEEEEEEGN